MPGDGSNLSPATPVLTRLPAPLDRSCSTHEDVRLSAGTRVSQLFSQG
jgi:hypothetical protein